MLPGAAATTAAAAAADGHLVYAIGDLHGRIDLLDRMLEMVTTDAALSDAPHKTIVYLGDYVDRGHDSKGVIERIMAGPPPGFQQICLLGNHESWLLDFLDDAKAGAGWFLSGGVATLASYGVAVAHGNSSMARLEKAQSAFAGALPAAHRAFLEDLSWFWRSGDYIFVHAGVRPGVPIVDQDPEDLIWIREDFLQSTEDFGAMIIHGHTIQDYPDERHNRIGIDTGAFASGRLTCIRLEGAERRYLQT